MTLTLSSESQSRLAHAATRDGVAIDAVVERLVSENLPPNPFTENRIRAKQQALVELLAVWFAEDATDDEAELTRRDAENHEFFENLMANRISFPVPEL